MDVEGHPLSICRKEKTPIKQEKKRLADAERVAFGWVSSVCEFWAWKTNEKEGQIQKR